MLADQRHARERRTRKACLPEFTEGHRLVLIAAANHAIRCTPGGRAAWAAGVPVTDEDVTACINRGLLAMNADTGLCELTRRGRQASRQPGVGQQHAA